MKMSSMLSRLGRLLYYLTTPVLLAKWAFRLISYLGVPALWTLKLIRLIIFGAMLTPAFLTIFVQYFFSETVKRSVRYGPYTRNDMDIFIPKDNVPSPVCACRIEKLLSVRPSTSKRHNATGSSTSCTCECPCRLCSSKKAQDNRRSGVVSGNNTHSGGPTGEGTKLRKRPVAIFVCGGAWIIGYKWWGLVLARYLSCMGIVCVLPDYRNFPQAKISGMIADVNTCIDFVLEHVVPEYNCDPNLVYLIGQSAGAHISACVMIERALQCVHYLEKFPEEHKVIFNILNPGFNPVKPDNGAKTHENEAERRISRRLASQESDQYFPHSDKSMYFTGIRRWIGISGPYDLISSVTDFAERGMPYGLMHSLFEADFDRYSPSLYAPRVADVLLLNHIAAKQASLKTRLRVALKRAGLMKRPLDSVNVARMVAGKDSFPIKRGNGNIPDNEGNVEEDLTGIDAGDDNHTADRRDNAILSPSSDVTVTTPRANLPLAVSSIPPLNVSTVGSVNDTESQYSPVLPSGLKAIVESLDSSLLGDSHSIPTPGRAISVETALSDMGQPAIRESRSGSEPVLKFENGIINSAVKKRRGEKESDSSLPCISENEESEGSHSTASAHATKPPFFAVPLEHSSHSTMVKSPEAVGTDVSGISERHEQESSGFAESAMSTLHSVVSAITPGSIVSLLTGSSTDSDSQKNAAGPSARTNTESLNNASSPLRIVKPLSPDTKMSPLGAEEMIEEAKDEDQEDLVDIVESVIPNTRIIVPAQEDRAISWRNRVASLPVLLLSELPDSSISGVHSVGAGTQNDVSELKHDEKDLKNPTKIYSSQSVRESSKIERLRRYFSEDIPASATPFFVSKDGSGSYRTPTKRPSLSTDDLSRSHSSLHGVSPRKNFFAPPAAALSVPPTPRVPGVLGLSASGRDLSADFTSPISNFSTPNEGNIVDIMDSGEQSPVYISSDNIARRRGSNIFQTIPALRAAFDTFKSNLTGQMESTSAVSSVTKAAIPSLTGATSLATPVTIGRHRPSLTAGIPGLHKRGRSQSEDVVSRLQLSRSKSTNTMKQTPGQEQQPISSMRISTMGRRGSGAPETVGVSETPHLDRVRSRDGRGHEPLNQPSKTHSNQFTRLAPHNHSRNVSMQDLLSSLNGKSNNSSSSELNESSKRERSLSNAFLSKIASALHFLNHSQPQGDYLLEESPGSETSGETEGFGDLRGPDQIHDDSNRHIDVFGLDDESIGDSVPRKIDFDAMDELDFTGTSEPSLLPHEDAYTIPPVTLADVFPRVSLFHGAADKTVSYLSSVRMAESLVGKPSSFARFSSFVLGAHPPLSDHEEDDIERMEAQLTERYRPKSRREYFPVSRIMKEIARLRHQTASGALAEPAAPSHVFGVGLRKEDVTLTIFPHSSHTDDVLEDLMCGEGCLVKDILELFAFDARESRISASRLQKGNDGNGLLTGIFTRTVSSASEEKLNNGRNNLHAMSSSHSNNSQSLSRASSDTENSMESAHNADENSSQSSYHPHPSADDKGDLPNKSTIRTTSAPERSDRKTNIATRSRKSRRVKSSRKKSAEHQLSKRRQGFLRHPAATIIKWIYSWTIWLLPSFMRSIIDAITVSLLIVLGLRIEKPRDLPHASSGLKRLESRNTSNNHESYVMRLLNAVSKESLSEKAHKKVKSYYLARKLSRLLVSLAQSSSLINTAMMSVRWFSERPMRGSAHHLSHKISGEGLEHGVEIVDQDIIWDCGAIRVALVPTWVMSIAKICNPF